jgi:hypothetical protein
MERLLAVIHGLLFQRNVGLYFYDVYVSRLW